MSNLPRPDNTPAKDQTAANALRRQAASLPKTPADVKPNLEYHGGVLVQHYREQLNDPANPKRF